MCKRRPIMRSKSGTARFVIAGNETIGDCAGGDVHHQNQFAARSQAGLYGGAAGRATFRSAARRRGRHNSGGACRTADSPTFRSGAIAPALCSWTSSRMARRPRRRGRRFRRRQQQRADAAPADMRGDGDGIEPGELGARPDKAPAHSRRAVPPSSATISVRIRRARESGESFAATVDVGREDSRVRARAAHRDRAAGRGAVWRGGALPRCRLTRRAPVPVRSARSSSPAAPAGRPRPAACPSAAG